MKIQKSELAQKISKIKSVVPKKATMPVLQGVLVRDGYLIANNMEIAVKAKIEGIGDETFIIPAKAFDLINNLPEGEVEITADNKKSSITIKAEKIKNTYKTMDPDSFPLNDAVVETGVGFAIESEKLLESMRRVSYAIPAVAGNPVMSALCMKASGGTLNFVGLDGHVLAWDQIEYDGDFTLLVPKNAVEKLQGIGLVGEVSIRYNDNAAIFITEEYEVFTRLVNGEYFKYDKMFSTFPLQTYVTRKELLNAMVRAKMCTDERSPVRFLIKDNVVNISIKDATADYQEEILLREAFPKELLIGFDAKLVIETMKAFDCENVGIQFANKKMPMLVEAEDSDFKALVLPVNIG